MTDKTSKRMKNNNRLILAIITIITLASLTYASDLSGFTNINATNFYQSGQLVLDAASSWSGDLTGTGLSPEVTDDSHSHSQLTITADTIDGTELNDTITLDANLLIQGYNVSINGTTFNVDSTNERVGIGTTTPEKKLHVVGNIRLNGSEADGSTALEFGNNAVLIDRPATTNRLNLFGYGGFDFGTTDTGAGGAVTILQDGKVGIGTTTPSSPLHVVGDANITGDLISDSIYDVSSQGLVLAMNFNNESITGNTVLDSSGKNNHGTNNGATHNASGGFNNGGAYEFDNTDLISVTDAGTFDYLDNAAEVTITFWMKPLSSLFDPSNGNRYVAVGKFSNADNRLQLGYFIPATSVVYYFIKVGGNDGQLSESSSYYSPDKWTHIAYVFIGNERATVYRDGVMVLNRSISFSGLPDTNNLRIGNSNYYWNGSIDEVKIYERALTAEEIKRLYLQRAEVQDSFVSQTDIYVDSSGNVGIGTNSPDDDLEIEKSTSGSPVGMTIQNTNAASGSNAQLKLQTNAGFWTFAQRRTDGVLEILSDTLKGMYINPTTGRLGIGTDSPNAKLTLQGIAGTSSLANNGIVFDQVEGSASATYSIGLSFDKSSVFRGGMQIRSVDLGANSDTFIDFITTEGGVATRIAMTIDEEQNIGIGTTNPTDKLTIAHSTPNTGMDFAMTDGQNPVSITFYEKNFIVSNGYQASITARIQNGLNTTDRRGAITFEVKTGGTALGTRTEVMRIDGNGNRVGIGTPSPGLTLEVENTGASTVLRIQDSSNTCDFGVDGNGWASIFCTSDEKLKEDITEVPELTLKNIADWIYNYPLKEYTMKANGERQIGVIAQEIQLLDPSKVANITEFNPKTNQTESYLTVQVPTTSDLIITIKDLKESVEILEKENVEIIELKEEVKELKEMIKELQ